MYAYIIFDVSYHNKRSLELVRVVLV